MRSGYREGRRHNHFVGHQGTVPRSGRYGDGRHPREGYTATKSRSRSRSLSPTTAAGGRPRHVLHMDMQEGKRYTLDDRMGGPAHNTNSSSATTLMSFRQFVLDHTEDDPEDNPNSAVLLYDRYKVGVIQKAAKKYFAKNKSSGYMLETYHPDFIRKMQQHEALQAVQRADAFIKQWRLGVYKGARLVTSPRVRSYEGGKYYYDKEEYKVAADCIASLAIQAGANQSSAPAADTTGTAPYFAVDMDALCLKLHHVSARLSYWDVKEAVEKVEGICDISMSKPSHSTMYKERLAWLKFNSQTARYTALSQLSRMRIKDGHVLQPALEYSKPLGGQELTVLPIAMSTKERIKHDVRRSAELIRKYDREYGVTGGSFTGTPEEAKVDEDTAMTTGGTDAGTHTENPIFKREEEDCTMGGVVADTDEAQLDLQILYLQKVHKIDYYSGVRFDTQRALWRCVGAGHVRTYLADVVSLVEEAAAADQGEDKDKVQTEILSQALKADEYPWIARLDEKIDALLEAHRVEPPTITADDPAIVAKWRDFCEENTNSVDTAKWRCGICNKMFKGAEFVHKHLKNKHSNNLDKIIASGLDHLMEDAYLNDPDKIVPINGPGLNDRRQPFHRHTSGGANLDEKFDFDKPRQRHVSDTGRHGRRHSDADRYWAGTQDPPVDSTGALLHHRERYNMAAGGFSNTGTYVDRDNPPVDISMPLVVPSEVRATVRYDDL